MTTVSQFLQSGGGFNQDHTLEHQLKTSIKKFISLGYLGGYDNNYILYAEDFTQIGECH